MILAIDVGNTNIVLGVYDGEELVANWRITTLNNRTADETGTLIRSLFSHSNMDIKEIESVIISSVVPNIMYSLTNAIRKQLHIEPMIVGAGMKTGIVIKRDNPKEEMITASIQLAFTSEASKRECINIPVSSAVFFVPVAILQYFTILLSLYTPKTIFVFPTSITKSINLPSYFLCLFFSYNIRNPFKDNTGSITSNISPFSSITLASPPVAITFKLGCCNASFNFSNI